MTHLTAPSEASQIKDHVASIVRGVCQSLGVVVAHDARLPISGDMEAEVIHMQYPMSRTPGFVLAVAESQKAVGIKQFNRANYYTGKTVAFSPLDFAQLLRAQVRH